MTKQKQGYKRIMGEIPNDVYNKITWYNKIGSFSLNVSRAIEICLTERVKEIEEEAIDYVKKNGGIVRGSDKDYNNAVEGIKTGLSAYEVYEIAISDMHTHPNQHILRSQVYLPLLPVNQMKFNEDKQKICFFVDKLPCFSIIPCDIMFDNAETIGGLKKQQIDE